jgi:hypothetical protein
VSSKIDITICKPTPKSLTDEALDYIGRLYRIDKEARRRDLNVHEIYQLRQKRSKPLLDKFNTWLTTYQPLISPKGLLGQAIGYTLSKLEQAGCLFIRRNITTGQQSG